MKFLKIPMRAIYCFMMLGDKGAFSAEKMPSDLFRDGVSALEQERPVEAIAALEALADRGVQDGAISYDRGLAYALRVRLGAGQPGDLGQAVHAFEEARILSPDRHLQVEAAKAARTVRLEIARLQRQEGNQVWLEDSTPWDQAVLSLLPENVWAIGSLVASLLCSLAFAVWKHSPAFAIRKSGGIVLWLTSPLVVVLGMGSWKARSHRLTREEGVIIAPIVRLADEKGVPSAVASHLCEGIRVQVKARHGMWLHITGGFREGWVPSGTVRMLPK
ncbi:hypothetical protein [Pajaroellobacter abortibovis]|uniref:SH3b domain-containing protein n=1 Tax=Pajaroellobacter abortibovis TaxID=1882918 RepID=A0A1L6MW17_9BACT|nr:hypothetical protein [Pajaroellobacter abortibovis]APR99740.1 hypothetical protein BCY86_02910 [Pajaroellobacter abortibovis]